jgi:hypothetical protein
MSTGINIAPSSDLTVGTTAVTSGTNGRVFFQAGGVIQQDANFTYDNTLKRLGLKAVGTAATDIPFNIQNSAGTVNLLQQNGVGSILARSNDTFSYAGLFYRSDGTNGWSLTNSHSGYGQGTGIETVGGSNYILSSGTRALSIQRQSTGTFKTYGIWNYGSDAGQRLLIGENVFDPQLTLSGTGNLGIGTYTAGARLDVKAQGALSTDIAFRVRNSADTDNLIDVAGNGLVKFRTGTERIEVNTTASDYKISAYKFGVEMTKISTYSSYFCYGGSGQYLGIGTNAPSHLLDIYSSATPILTRWTNDENNLAGSDVTLKFTTRYTGGSQGGNPMAYLTVGGTGAGVNTNNKSYFKFLLSKANTLAERASITSQSNLLLQAPTEDTNDIGVIYIPNGTAPTVALAGGGKLYVEGGALKYIGSSGTITTVAPA